MPIIPLPNQIPWYLRPMLWLTKRLTGKDPLPARLLAYFPKGAIGAGLFELTAASAPRDLDGRSLAIARIVASTISGCPFCVDMNAATWQRAGLKAEELPVLFATGQDEDEDEDEDEARYRSLGEREAVVARFAKALSQTPVVLTPRLIAALNEQFTPKESVVLATTIAQVNYWTRFNQGLGVPAAGFFDESVCPLPKHAAPL